MELRLLGSSFAKLFSQIKGVYVLKEIVGRALTVLVVITALSICESKYGNIAYAESDLAQYRMDVLELKRLRDESHISESRKLGKALLERYSNRSDLYFEYARVLLDKTVKSDYILGWKYPPEVASQALSFLDKSLSAPDSYGRAHSLKLHIYNHTNDIISAKRAIDDFHSSGANDEWFQLNFAEFLLLTNEYDQAFSILEKQKNKTNKRIQYSSWALLRALRQRDSKYDASALVKSGQFLRVERESLLKSIEDFSDEKPVFLSVSSDQKQCGPCFKHNEALKKVSLSNDYTYLYVSQDPWWNFDYLGKELSEKYSIGGLPYSLVIYKNRVISFSNEQLAPKEFEFMLKNGLELKDKNSPDRLSNIESNEGYNYRTLRFAGMLSHYSHMKGHKAFAVAHKGNRYVVGVGKGKDKQSLASNKAMSMCESRKHRYFGKLDKSSCELFLKGDLLVNDNVNDETKYFIDLGLKKN